MLGDLEPTFSLKAMAETFDSSSSSQTRSWARGFAQRLTRFPACVFLEGPLGAGKTLFTKGLVEGLLGEEASRKVKSPSFVLLQEYRGSKEPLVVHADFYRLDSWENAMMEILDYLSVPCVLIVEWPKESQKFFLPHLRQAYNIHIHMMGPDKRRFVIEEP